MDVDFNKEARKPKGFVHHGRRGRAHALAMSGIFQHCEVNIAQARAIHTRKLREEMEFTAQHGPVKIIMKDGKLV